MSRSTKTFFILPILFLLLAPTITAKNSVSSKSEHFSGEVNVTPSTNTEGIYGSPTEAVKGKRVTFTTWISTVKRDDVDFGDYVQWYVIKPNGSVITGEQDELSCCAAGGPRDTATYTFQSTGNYKIKVVFSDDQSPSSYSPISAYWVVQVSEATGSLKVTISPSEARSNGAGWRVKDSDGNLSNWFTSGHTVSGLPTGNYTVYYNEISGWKSPDSDMGTITAKDTSFESGKYTPTFTNPSIVDRGISKSNISAPQDTPVEFNRGEEIRVWYEVKNPNDEQVEVVLGASLDPPEGSLIDDEANDEHQIISANSTRWFSRPFKIPNDAQVGKYGIGLGLLNPDKTEHYDDIDWYQGWVEVKEVSPDENVSISPVVPLEKKSVLQEGGMGFRLFKLVDEDGLPVGDKSLKIHIVNDGHGNSVDLTRTTDANGVFKCFFTGAKAGSTHTYTFETTNLSLNQQVSFDYKVISREWTKYWKAGSKVSKSIGITGYITAGNSDGLELGMDESGWMKINRNFQRSTGVGVQVGADFSLGGVVEASANIGSVEANIIHLQSDNYLFDQPFSSSDQQLAEAALLIATTGRLQLNSSSVGGASSPIAGLLIEAFTSNISGYRNYKHKSAFSYGLSGSLESGAELGIGFTDNGSRKGGLGFNAGATLDGKITALANMIKYPDRDQMGFEWSQVTDSFIGVSAILKQFPFFEKTDKFSKEIIFNSSTGEPEKLVYSLDNGSKVLQYIVKSDRDSDNDGTNDLQEMARKMEAVDRMIDTWGSLPMVPLGPEEIKNQFNQFLQIVKSENIIVDYKIISNEVSGQVTFGGDFTFSVKVTIGMGRSIEFNIRKRWLEERGYILNGKRYYTAFYTKDSFIKDSFPSFQEIIDKATDGLWRYVSDSLFSTWKNLQAGASWTMDVAVKTGEGVTAGVAEVAGDANSLSEDVNAGLNSWFEDTFTSKDGQLKTLSEPRQLAEPLRWEGLLSVGPFHKFEPEGYALEEPAELTLTYAQETVPSGLNETNINLYRWRSDEGRWVEVESQIDKEANEVTADIKIFSTYTLGIDVAPNAPSGLEARGGQDTVHLSWNTIEVSDFAGFNLYRSKDKDGAYNKLNDSPVRSTEYNDGNITPDTTYYYKLTSVDNSGNESGYSQIVQAKASATPAVFRVNAADNVYADKSFHGKTFKSGNADLAEKVKVNGEVEPGDVLSLDPTNPKHYRKSQKAYSPLATGVVSTRPGVTLSEGTRPLRATLALMGTVPVKATAENGPIQPGDLLATSSKPGYAMVCNDKNKCSGAIVGKALEPLKKGEEKILILVVG